ncbi:MAG: sensor histidine kinase [Aureliella sp.]
MNDSRSNERKSRVARKRHPRSIWTVPGRLNLMCFMIILSGSFGVIGAFEIAKGAKMHELNFLHVKHNHSFSNAVEQFQSSDASDTSAIRGEILLVRRQPIACLNLVGFFERQILSLVGTREAITICQEDIDLAQRTLLSVDSFDSGRIEKEELVQKLEQAVEGFTENSAKFEPLVAQTVSTVSTILVIVVTLKAFLVALSGYFLSRSIVADYRKVEVAEETLADDLSKRLIAEQERDALNEELQRAARDAGKAEVATGVLHNVGNVLNSVNISTNIIRQRVHETPLPQLEQVAEALETKTDLADFLTSDFRGKNFPKLIHAISDRLSTDHSVLCNEITILSKNIDHIKEIVSMQQSYAKRTGVLEYVSPKEILEDALKINEVGLTRVGIKVETTIEGIDPILTKRHEVLQILINLIKNARQALESCDTAPPKIHARVRLEDDFVRFEVEDNGIGMPAANLQKVFQHGFTTKKSGHGFGLHACANSAREMGGSLSVSSEGYGKGSTFTLKIPTDMTAERGTNREELEAAGI